jgi:hypothetical protein
MKSKRKMQELERAERYAFKAVNKLTGVDTFALEHMVTRAWISGYIAALMDETKRLARSRVAKRRQSR